MSWNPQYDHIGRTFVQQYYTCFDDPLQRSTLADFYDVEKSLMTFEDVQICGRTKIMEKITSLTFQKIAHSITSIDTQPMFDGGILVCVLGQLKGEIGVLTLRLSALLT
nr:probable nuclear transport factor 2 isoform X2 [Parasteatoda tepidariorum]